MTGDDKFILYSYWRSSCSWRVRIALNLKGIPFEYRPVNLLLNEQSSEAYLAINAAGLVPTLVIEKADGSKLVLSQSTAILEYLEEAYPTTRRLLPQDPLLRQRAREIYCTIACDVQPLQNLRILRTMEEPAKIEWGRKVVSRGLGTIEKLLEKSSGKYCVGDQITIADIALIPQLNRFGVNTEDYPRISAIAKHLEAKAEFIQADGANQPDHPSKQKLNLKPVDSLGPAGVKVRADADGFEDLDDYFSQEFENKTSLNSNNKGEVDLMEKIEESKEVEFIMSQPVHQSLGPNEYTVPIKGSSDDEAIEEEPGQEEYDYAPAMDDDYGADNQEEDVEEAEKPQKRMSLFDESSDNEINFSPNITLRRPASESPSVQAVASSPREKRKDTQKQKEVKKASQTTKRQQTQKAPSKPREQTTASSNGAEGGSFYLSDELKSGVGTRQSRRNRIAPLEFWRGERVKYSVDEDLRIPVIVGVVRRTKTSQKPRTRPPTRRKASSPSVKRHKAAVEKELEESGFVPDVKVVAPVMNYDSNEIVPRLVAVSPDVLEPEQVVNESFSIATVFEEGQLLTSGIMVFPPGVSKPSRNSVGHSIVFYVISGVFQVRVNETHFVVGTGGSFIVPRGNLYGFKNVHDGESKVHFVHCNDTARTNY